MHEEKVFTPNTKSESQRPLLVLDVDETLLHAADKPLKRSCDFRVGPYWVYRRPHLCEFLLRCNRSFELAVWSSSDADYLHAVLAQTIPEQCQLAFVWSRARCVRRYDAEWQEPYFVKDLRKVKQIGFDLAHTLIVDDTPMKLERNYGNAVYVRAFEGDEADDELVRLAPYLETLVSAEDVRRIEKRGWRSRTEVS